MNELTQASKTAKIWGWIIFIVGVLALLSPLASGVAVTVMVAILLIVAGVTRVIEAFQGGGFWTGLFGVLAVIAGLVMVGSPMLGLVSLTIVLIVYFLAMGISETIAAFQIRPEQGWGFLLFNGIVSVVLALLIWNQWPLSGNWAIGVLVGIQLISSSLTMIAVGLSLKTRQKPVSVRAAKEPERRFPGTRYALIEERHVLLHSKPIRIVPGD